jgi:hypothetical protein
VSSCPGTTLKARAPQSGGWSLRNRDLEELFGRTVD